MRIRTVVVIVPILLIVVLCAVVLITGLLPKHWSQEKWWALSLDYSNSKVVSIDESDLLFRMIAVPSGQHTSRMWGARMSGKGTYVAVSLENKDGTLLMPLVGKTASFLDIHKATYSESDSRITVKGGDGGFSYYAEFKFEVQGGAVEVLEAYDESTFGWFRGD